MKRISLTLALFLGMIALFSQGHLAASETGQTASFTTQSRCVIPESGPWPPCATGGEGDGAGSDCVIPESGPWPACATGGASGDAASGECVIPASGPWPACATGGASGGADSESNGDCVIPASGPWPACATGGGTASGGGEANTSSAYLGSYTISDTGYGTQVSVVVDSQAGTRTIQSNALPNHATGEFPNGGNPNTISAQDASWTFPSEPTFVGTASNAITPGVAINGIKFTPGTAERATCDTGEVHNIEAIQDVTSLGLDFNNAHVQPTGEYHYHGVSALLVDLYNNDQDLVHVAFAADGHLIYYSKSAAYQPSYRLGADAREGTNCTYTPGFGGETVTFGPVKDGALSSDWDYNASYGQLDECNGITLNGEYIYLITNDYPYVPRCLMGQSTGSGPGGGGPGGGGPGGGGPPGGRPPADGAPGQ